MILLKRAIAYVFGIIQLVVFSYEKQCVIQISISDSQPIEGSSVTINCTSSIGRFYWKMNNGTGFLAGLTDKGECYVGNPLNNSVEYSVSCENKTTTVKILNVSRKRHNETWSCAWQRQAGGCIESEIEIIHVTVPVKSVSVYPEATKPVMIVENTTMAFRCNTSFSHPTPSVFWFLRNGSTRHNITDSSVQITVSDLDNYTSTAVSHLNLTLNRTFNNWELLCEASNVKERENVSGVLLLNVTYPPNKPPRIGKYNNNDTYKVIASTQGHLYCAVDGGNPPAFLAWDCSWSVPDNTITYHENSTVVNNIEWAASALGQTFCRCESKFMNKTTQTTNINIDVLYPPKRPDILVNSTTVSGIVKVIEGNTLVVKCNSSSNPRSTFQWMTDNFTWSGCKLDISNIDRTAAKNYTCYVTNIMSQSDGQQKNGTNSSSITVDVLYSPSVRKMENVTAIEGDTFNITCDVSPGNPNEFSTYWSSNGTTVSYNKTIHIIDIKRNGYGDFTCVANNTMEPSVGRVTHGSSNGTFTLSVHYPPVNTSVRYENKPTGEQTIHLLENASFNLTCYSEGKPRPNYKWFVNHIEDGQTPVKEINRISRRMRGKFTCQAYNQMHRTHGEPKFVTAYENKSIYIDVLFPAEFKHVLNNASVLEGTPFTKECMVIPGNPAETVYSWTRNDGIHITDKSMLEIMNATRENDTVFTCEIYNLMIPTYGSNSTQPFRSQFHLNVLFKATVSSLSANGNPSEANVTIAAGKPLSVQCTTDGNPAAEALLVRKIQLEKIGNNISHIQHNVSKASYKDAGIYECTAQNEYNKGTPSSKHIRITVKVKPRPYLDLPIESKVVTKLHRTVTLNFVAHPYLDDPGKTNFTWRKGTLQLPLKDTKFIIITDGLHSKLNITDITDSDLGNYSLVVTNTNGNYIQNYEILIDTISNSATGTDNTGAIVGGTISGIVVIVAILIALFIIRKRRGKEPEQSFYQNVPFGVGVKNKKSESQSESKTRDETPMEVLQDVDDIPTNQNECTQYYNCGETVETLKRFKIHELLALVSGRTEKAFKEEYQTLPTELKLPCTFAMRPENKALIRYKGIIPYDHSRVKIDGQSDFFMNACYIDGYRKPNAYIASLGAIFMLHMSRHINNGNLTKKGAGTGPTIKTTENFINFWKMLWFHQSDIIVMLTNINESSVSKCDHYWPDNNTNKSYGDFHVNHGESQEVFVEYTVRHLVVTFNGQKRRVTHLHYTAWPDKKVPEDAATLLDFRQRLKTTHTLGKGPIIVHCSAGIGRTGTLIALDRLVAEGKNEGSVDVYTCVNSIREQRVKMVQTLEQYIYIYKALVCRLYFECETIALVQFHSYVQTLNNNTIREQFQSLKQSVEIDSKEEITARRSNERLATTNGQDADIPGNRYRVRLFQHKDDQDSDYINAVYLNTFRKVEHFIIAQSPLSNGVYDFISMIHQENCSCIVTMEDMQEQERGVGSYLPSEGQTLNLRNFTVSCKTLDTNPDYIVREMRIQNNSKIGKSEHVAYHFHFTSWMSCNVTPKDVKKFVQFVKAVEAYHVELCEEESHVLVHCSKASERSALFCLVSILLEKIQYEGYVNVLNTVRHMRTRRKEAITNMEQLKFCYQALDHFIGTSLVK